MTLPPNWNEMSLDGGGELEVETDFVVDITTHLASVPARRGAS
jgi:hypothetical protein